MSNKLEFLDDTRIKFLVMSDLLSCPVHVGAKWILCIIYVGYGVCMLILLMVIAGTDELLLFGMYALSW